MGSTRSRLSLFNILKNYEELKGEINRRPMYEYRCDERLKDKGEGSTCLTFTGFRGGLERLKIETRLRDERFASVMGVCVMDFIMTR